MDPDSASSMSEATDAVVRVKFAVAGEPAHEYVASSSAAEALSFNAADGAEARSPARKRATR